MVEVSTHIVGGQLSNNGCMASILVFSLGPCPKQHSQLGRGHARHTSKLDIPNLITHAKLGHDERCGAPVGKRNLSCQAVPHCPAALHLATDSFAK